MSSTLVRKFSTVCSATLFGIAIGAVGMLLWGTRGVADLRETHEFGRVSSMLTSPLLECNELSENVTDETLNSLHAKLEKTIHDSKGKGDITYASVYFRDLNNGPWLGIDESEEFFPASLLKLPLAMSFYNKAEDDPTILTKEITYTPDPSTLSQVQPFGPKTNVEAGKKYTVQELIDIMLQESSNESATTLAEVAGENQIISVYRVLGLQVPEFGKDYKIDTHKYASFFRILYNATYVDHKASEKILQSLTKSSFQEGIVAGVPSGIVVAHKFGSRQVDAGGQIVQLHDCGIVYASQTPYILCVMTQGTDFTKLAGFIKNISSLVYENVFLKKP